jgi:hypothetical protein
MYTVAFLLNLNISNRTETYTVDPYDHFCVFLVVKQIFYKVVRYGYRAAAWLLVGLNTKLNDINCP